ncbi:MAG: DUF4215 domain-containing protein [Candidatus Peribacteraceae bacterium]
MRFSSSSSSVSSRSFPSSQPYYAAVSSFPYAFCGDGIKQPQEQCDDGQRNGQTDANCGVTCQTKHLPGCGDSVLAPGEECDPGGNCIVNGSVNGKCSEPAEATMCERISGTCYAVESDECTAQCRYKLGECGDGILEAALGEECDAGQDNGREGADCDASCRYVKLPQCGDGAIDPLTELCDFGRRNGDYPGAPCRDNCMLPRCGDSILDPNEECDDGNNLDADGCAADCTLPREAAPPYTAVLAPPISVPGTSGTPFQPGTPGQPPELLPRNIPTPARQPTGPGLVIFLASGAAAGIGLVRRRLFGRK